MNAEEQIRSLLERFQAGYTARDVAVVEPFMELFTPDAEVIGTNGTAPGNGEWFLGREAARALVQGDWESWGDLRLDLNAASVHARGDVGWIAVTGTVTHTIGPEEYEAYLAYVQQYIAESPLPAEEKLRYILRGATNTLYELSRGERFVWPLRLTATVVRDEGNWRFCQMCFSFPTTYFPDERIVEPA